MATLVEQASCVDAWRAACQHVVGKSGHDSNLIVVISDPQQFDSQWLQRFNPAAVRHGADRIRDVINTIFPQKTLRNSANRRDFYLRYERAHSRSRQKRWGTYFLRMINFGVTRENQLENIIDALTRWKNNPQAALTIHLSSPETDSLRPLGAPCLHFAELLCPTKDTLELVAVYRNHDYFNKVLGNFIGLSRLLAFVAAETGRRPTRIVCHSVRAYFEASKQDMLALLAR